jgi:nucleoside-diphosphate kinase
MNRTLVIFKTDAYRRRVIGEILTRFERKRMRIVGIKVLRPDVSLLAEHYREHKGREYFQVLLDMMSRGFVVPCVLEGHDQNTINLVRTMLGPYRVPGPGTIRGDYQCETVSMSNLLHASASRAEAEREIALWFRPDELLPETDYGEKGDTAEAGDP